MRIARPFSVFLFLLFSLTPRQPVYSQATAPSANSSGPAVQRRGTNRCLYFTDADKTVQEAAHYKAAAEEVANADPPNPCLPTYLSALLQPPNGPRNEQAIHSSDPP